MRRKRPAKTPRVSKASKSRAALNDPWPMLRQFTAARIGLPRSGASLATAPLLELRLAHARARDAVHERFDTAHLVGELATLGLPVLTLASAAEDRQHYLMRPDLGRRLGENASAELAPPARECDVAFVIADGLSARAVATHAQPVLAQVLPRLRAKHWRIAPLTVVRHGRVAIGDA